MTRYGRASGSLLSTVRNPLLMLICRTFGGVEDKTPSRLCPLVTWCGGVLFSHGIACNLRVDIWNSRGVHKWTRDEAARVRETLRRPQCWLRRLEISWQGNRIDRPNWETTWAEK